ncbi:hypothetical protein CY34DRAFT_19379 [Suillus luteus UH-Slu-Lm8-n1]|uniref:Uncharacterized protein n=1 Tax=Suillus luteus UH-Slu-Lm8-n1 TaxID=930992 RepID=A0A0C9ZRS4_9AGAM|nr:hypothetical protein CY34DRAFT_19379 [Suillus luteus UH-Slu-Lm8-n1]
MEGRAQRQPEVDEERRHREEAERKAIEAESRADEERRQREEEKRKADAENRRADEERRQREEAEREYEAELNRMRARMAELERRAVGLGDTRREMSKNGLTDASNVFASTSSEHAVDLWDLADTNRLVPQAGLWRRVRA